MVFHDLLLLFFKLNLDQTYSRWCQIVIFQAQVAVFGQVQGQFGRGATCLVRLLLDAFVELLRRCQRIVLGGHLNKLGCTVRDRRLFSTPLAPPLHLKLILRSLTDALWIVLAHCRKVHVARELVNVR